MSALARPAPKFVSGASGLMVLTGSSIPAASPVAILSWLKVGVIVANALNNVVNNESIESVLVLDCSANESIPEVDESALGNIPELGMEKKAGQSDTHWRLTLPGPAAQSPSMSRIRREASPSVVASASSM